LARFGAKTARRHADAENESVGLDFDWPDQAGIVLAASRSEQRLGFIVLADPAQLADHVVKIGHVDGMVIGG
jgi:hypothetical protein